VLNSELRAGAHEEEGKYKPPTDTRGTRFVPQTAYISVNAGASGIRYSMHDFFSLDAARE
jgi:hypothetical protein